MLRELTVEEKRDILDRANRLMKAVCDFADPFYWLDEGSTDEVLVKDYPFNLSVCDAAWQTRHFVENIHRKIGELRIDD